MVGVAAADQLGMMPAAAIAASVSGPNKKAQRLAELGADRGRVRPVLRTKVGAQPERLINIFNMWTHEWLAVSPTQAVPTATVADFFRCHFTGERAEFDERLLPRIVAAARHFRRDHVQVVSGFRHPKYNLMLRKKGRNVARTSEHQEGNAVDFRIPGVSLHTLQRWVFAQRLGGAGRYDKSKFVHMDTGARRRWRGD